MIPIRPKLSPAKPTLPAPTLPSQWRARWLLAAPHRLAFFAAALMLGGSALWWTAIVLLQNHLTVPWAIAPTLAHSLWMLFGFMPLFFSGFLFTAGPKWLSMPEVSAHSIRPPVLLCVCGWLLFVAGAHFSASLNVLGLALVTIGWSRLTTQFIRLLRRSRAKDKVHATCIAAACGLGAVLMAGVVLCLYLQHYQAVRAVVQVALWAFVGVVYVAVAHRMIPFFTSNALPLLDAWRPQWLLWLLIGVMTLEGVMGAAEIWIWPLPAGLRVAQTLVEVAAASLLLWLAIRWGLLKSLKVRLLAMLHLGFVWLGLTLLLLALSHSLELASAGTLTLGLAPTHAFTMGFLTSLLVAMATRVSSGHSGRSLAADDLVWAMYWTLQLAVVLRLLVAIATAFGASGSSWVHSILSASALAWLVAVGAWAVRYGNWFGRPRVDGRPG